MAKITASNITVKQVAGWQWATDQWNASETARKAALTPPEVHVPILVDDYASLRVAEVGDSYASQADQADIDEISAAFRAANAAKRAAIKASAK